MVWSLKPPPFLRYCRDDKPFYCVFLKNEVCIFLQWIVFQPPLVGGYKWYWIKMPTVQGDAETQTALFQLSDYDPTPLLGFFFNFFYENYPTFRPIVWLYLPLN